MGLPHSDSSKELPALLTVESSIYWTLAWRSSGENASLFQALPLCSCYDAPSPLTDVMSPCQFNCGPFAVNHQDSLQLVSSLFNHIQWLAFSTVSWRAFVMVFLFFGPSPATLIHFVMLVTMNPLQPTWTGKCVAFHPSSSHSSIHSFFLPYWPFHLHFFHNPL